MKNVQSLLQEQKEARKEFKMQQAQEREAMAINVLADTREVLKALKCEYLLEQEVKEVIVEKEQVNVSINKGKIVQIVKEVKVQDTNNTDILKQAIKSKDEYIIQLEEQLQNKAFNAAENGYVVDGIEVSVDIVKELNNQIAKLQEQLACITLTSNEEIVMDDESAYLEYLASQEEHASVIEEQVVVPPVKKEEKVIAPVTTEAYVKQLKANISKYNGSARIYQTDKCYLIASPTTDEITWLSNVELSDEYKLLIESKLVNEFKFLPARTKLSPVTVTRDNAYMARVSAKDGYQNFSMRDVLSGYVKINNKFYLYSYSPASTSVFVEDFDKKRRGEAKTFPAGMKDKIVPVVMDMYKEYKALVDTKVKENDLKAEEAALRFNERVASRDKQREADKEIVARTLKGKKTVESNKKPKAAIVMSDTLAELESEIF